MSSFQNVSEQPAKFSIAANCSSSSDAVHTPVAATTGTTVFLREEGGSTFMPVFHQSSVTLRDLAEEFNISSVLECDAHGNVQPRAVAFDSPSDVLRSGRHYIARRDAKAEMRSSYVTFRGKICVKEYELEHPTPPAARTGKTVTVAPIDSRDDGPSGSSRAKPATTPFPDKRRQQEARDQNEEHFAAHAADGATPGQRQTDNEENEEETTISRALALSFERKRPRDESLSAPEEAPQRKPERYAATSEAAPAVLANDEVINVATSAPISSSRGGGVLHDRTNSSLVLPTAASKIQAVQTTAAVAEPLPGENSASAPKPKQSLRFIPFAETADDGSETYVTLESLQQLCQDVSAQEEEFQKKHRAATDILESARRVLFLNDGSE